ncbi:restriction endonuclease subunit S [Cupriavidus taiwanensis]|uniref:restriction endonuclease subunit S n=1 Tax=Cupriavidus taiwanensis TaxID=164546 RepID=UPI0039C03286
MRGLPKGWEIANLEELCERIVDGSHNPPKAAEAGRPMLSARNIADFRINFDDYRLISEADFELENSRTYVSAGDILLTIVGTIGRTAVVPEQVQNFALQRSVAVLKPWGINAHYIAYALSAPEIQQWLQDNAKGTAQKGVYLKTLGTLPISVAPKHEQARIVAKLEELLADLDAGVGELKTAQKKLQQYRQSLLKAAVEGTLTAPWREAQRKLGAPSETGAQLLDRILTERRTRWEDKQLTRFKEQGKTQPKNWQKKYPEPLQPDTNDLLALPNEWVWASVEQLGDVQLGRQRSPDKLKGIAPTRYIRAANITEAGIDFSDVLEMDFSEQERSVFGLQVGDVLLTEASGSAEHVGRPAVWPKVEGLFCFQNTVLRFTPQGVSSAFAFFSFLAMPSMSG